MRYNHNVILVGVNDNLCLLSIFYLNITAYFHAFINSIFKNYIHI